MLMQKFETLTYLWTTFLSTLLHFCFFDAYENIYKAQRKPLTAADIVIMKRFV